MRTFEELAGWCAGAAEECGDPSRYCGQAFVRWVDDLPNTDLDERLAFGFVEGELVLALGPQFEPLPLTIKTGAPEIGEDGCITFGADPITAGVWGLTPSFNAVGIVHAFIVLYDVPNPAPWERRIWLPPGVSA